MEFFLNSGQIFTTKLFSPNQNPNNVCPTTLLSSTIDRHYKTITLDFILKESEKSSFSTIDIGLRQCLDTGPTTIDLSTTLNTSIIIDSENITSKTLTFPNTVISKDLELIIQLNSYTFNHTPFIDKITLSW